MRTPTPVTLTGHGLTLEPLSEAHADGLAEAASDGRLWELWYTSVPDPDTVTSYIEAALAGQAAGHMLPWAVLDTDGRVLGSTRYHDIVTAAGRVEIGYTWYAAGVQGTGVNPAAKLLLLEHAFDTLECGVVALRTDRLNARSRAAIQALGAQLDGVLRHHQPRPDGTVRDTALYSILDREWPDVRRLLATRLARAAR